MTSLVTDPKNIRLGILGLTEGNGHPYSWSAMFNRFDRELMQKECPFPAIPDYLYLQDYEKIGIPGARMEYVCCDQRRDAEHVAKLSLIPHVADHPEELIGKVDAVIIATDIGSEHRRRARPFIAAGMPLFIDKPLCDNAADLDFFTRLFEEGYPILSSSSMRYCKETVPFHHGKLQEFGELRLLEYGMPKKWETYGIHSLEAIYPITGPGFVSLVNTGSERRNIVHLKHRDGYDVLLTGIYDYANLGGLFIGGTKRTTKIEIGDSYHSFRSQLVAFINFLRTGERPFPWQETVELMKLVIAGIKSRDLHGQEILIQ